MGSKNKLKRFDENKTFANLVQPKRSELIEGSFPYKGQWRSNFFKNDYPIVLELGCGKGEYTLALAEKYPEKNFIGIDIKGARIWRGAKNATEQKRSNVGFIRTQIELIEDIFNPSEVDGIWITFPDPQIKFKRTKHRLINPTFINQYKNILSPKSIIHLKTDSEFLHGYTIGLLQGLGVEILYAHHDIYSSDHVPKEVTDIKTFYEQQYLLEKKPITYLSFKF